MLLKPFVDNYDYPLTSSICGDETYVKVNGKWHYVFFIFDTIKKIITSHHVSPNRDTVAAIKAIEAIDECVGEVVNFVEQVGGQMFITADHGNADKMYEPDGSPFTAHTTNPVPFIVVGEECKLRDGGILADIAPTMLKLLNLPQPDEMTGKSIIE